LLLAFVVVDVLLALEEREGKKKKTGAWHVDTASNLFRSVAVDDRGIGGAASWLLINLFGNKTIPVIHFATHPSGSRARREFAEAAVLSVYCSYVDILFLNVAAKNDGYVCYC
jgi:hypothetical protein